MRSCAAAAVVAFLVVGVWLLAVETPYGVGELLTAEAAQGFVAIGALAALVTFACASLISALLFLMRRPLLKLLNGSLPRYAVAGAVLGAASVAVMWGVGFPPDPSDLFLAAIIACVAAPAASATFWASTRKA